MNINTRLGATVKLTVLESAAGSCCSDLCAPMPPAEAERRAAIFKALGDPARVQLLRLVAKAGRTEACVCDLTEVVGLSQPTVSHHLGILVKAGLLERERRGTWAWYRLSDAGLAAARAALDLQ